MKHPSPTSCRFHAGQASRWYCEPCQLPLCTSCKPYAERLPIEVDCPLCGKTMQDQLAGAESAGLGRMALQNAASLPALVIAACAAAIAALGFGSLPGLILTLPLGATLLSLMIVLARRAGEGQPQPPTIRELFDIDQIEYCLRILPFGLPFAVVLIAASAATSPLLATLAWLVVAAVLPAALTAAIVFESPRAGLSPSALARVFEVTGQQYIPIALVSVAAVIVVAIASNFAGSAAPAVRGSLALVATLLALGLSSRLGTIARIHRRMLEYPAGVAAIDRPRKPEPSTYEPALMAADAEVLLLEKRTHEARQLLGRALTRYPDEPGLNALFDQLVAETARPAEYRNHLERRMQRLIRAGQVAAATELWQRNSPRLDNWTPRVSETRYRLALELDELGEHQAAFRLLISLPPEDGKFARIAEAWLEAARILEDRLDDPARARELRQIVQLRFPERARKWRARWRQRGNSDRGRQDTPAASAHG